MWYINCVKHGDPLPKSVKRGTFKTGDPLPKTMKRGTLKYGDPLPRSMKGGTLSDRGDTLFPIFLFVL